MMKAFPLMVLLAVAIGCQQQQQQRSATPVAMADEAAQSGDGSLKIMTFNLRYASNKAPNAWPVRRPVMKECIQSVNPDVFGTQEGLYPQLKDIEHDLGDYAWIGVGRDGGSHGEFMAVFYRKSRLEPLEYDYFWLSDTPSVVGSTKWGNTNRRMVTWVKFRDRQTDKQFYFWNTHLDHQIQTAREKAAELIRKRVEALGVSLPIILVGDFNAKAKDNKAYDILTEGGFFKDAWEGEEMGTFHDFTGKPTNVGRIDWIFTRGEVTAQPPKIVKFEKNGQWPSDHWPVATTVKM